MAVTYVNNGGLVTSGGQSTLTPSLPASRVNGNVMISFYTGSNNVGTKLSGASITNGWVRILGNDTTSNLGVAWRIVNGSEAAPVWQNSGSNTAGDAVVAQYTGNAASPIGAAATDPSPSIVTTGSNSLAVYIEANFNNTLPGLATGFTSELTNSGGVADGCRLSDKAVAISGTTVTPDQHATGANYLLELLATVPTQKPHSQGVLIW